MFKRWNTKVSNSHLGFNIFLIQFRLFRIIFSSNMLNFGSKTRIFRFSQNKNFQPPMLSKLYHLYSLGGKTSWESKRVTSHPVHTVFSEEFFTGNRPDFNILKKNYFIFWMNRQKISLRNKITVVFVYKWTFSICQNKPPIREKQFLKIHSSLTEQKNWVRTHSTLKEFNFGLQSGIHELW